jgi:hypothetical protein
MGKIILAAIVNPNHHQNKTRNGIMELNTKKEMQSLHHTCKACFHSKQTNRDVPHTMDKDKSRAVNQEKAKLNPAYAVFGF